MSGTELEGLCRNVGKAKDEGPELGMSNDSLPAS